MKRNKADQQTHLYLITAIILLAGLGSSTLIYLTADEIGIDSPFEDALEGSKSYRHNLELYGGKANLLASEFMHWFHGLWHGKALGVTFACLTIFICCGILLIAYNLPSDPGSGSQGDH